MKTVLALKIAVFVTCLMGLSFLVIKYRGIKIEQEDIGIFEEAIALDCEANSLELTKDLFMEHYTEQKTVEPCPAVPPQLVGRLKVPSPTDPPPDTWQDVETGIEVLPGGKFVPAHCRARSRVAIIIPYREREENLKMLLRHLHPVLKRQEIVYGIYVVNQADDDRFNKGQLMNSGFREAIRDFPNWDCFVFHDVDLLPEDDRNIYECSELGPRHLSVAVNTMNYTLMYGRLFGGVTAQTRRQFETLNGYSNQFWQWGAEDDDMWNRIENASMNITLYPGEIARYSMLHHEASVRNPNRFTALMQGVWNLEADGLSNHEYTLKGIQRRKLFTQIDVSVKDIKPPFEVPFLIGTIDGATAAVGQAWLNTTERGHEEWVQLLRMILQIATWENYD